MHSRLIPALALALLATATMAQEQPQPAPEEPAAEAAPRGDDREMLRARLERRLQESKESQERLERALALLDQGGTTDRVREEAGGPMRRFSRDRHEGPREGGDGGHRPPPPGPPTREAIMRFLDEHNPEFASRLRETASKNPEAADRIMNRIEPHFREIIGERDPEMREYRIENMRLGWEIMSSSRELTEALRKDEQGAPDAAAVRDRLRTLLGSQFDLQVKMHDREIALLERRLGELRQRVQERTETRDTFIADKSAQIEAMATRFAERDPREGPPRRDGQRKDPPRDR